MADGSVCVCVHGRSVWTLIAVQALMVRAQLCVCAEYWSPSNFSWSDPSQPDNTHTHTWEHSADSRSRSWDDTQVNTDRISKNHKLSVSALASDWPTGLIASDCFTNLSLYYIFIWCVIKRLSLVWRLNYIQENMFRSEFKPLIMAKITWTGEIWQFPTSPWKGTYVSICLHIILPGVFLGHVFLSYVYVCVLSLRQTAGLLSISLLSSSFS